MKYKQQYTSQNTSINTVSAVYKYINQQNAVILDYGGGKYDTNAEFMKKTCNSIVLVYDPYNRPKEHNEQVRNYFVSHPAKIVVCSNVLCVIKEDEVILDILRDMFNLMDWNALLYIKVYERDKTGIGCETTKGWQRNQRLDDYKPFIKNAFGKNCEIRKKNDILIVKKVKAR